MDAALAAQADRLRELVRVIERRVAEGLTAEADLRRMEAERARVDLDRVRASLAATRALHGLAALLGPGEPVTLAGLVAPVDVPLPPGLDDQAITAALDRRPEVVAARARLAGARELVRLEEARGVPDLAVTGGWKRTSGYNTGVIAFSVPLPVFDRNRAGVTLAKGQVRAAELELDQAMVSGAAEVRTAIDAARVLSEQSARVRATLVQPAEIARAAARAAFESGAADVLRVVDAERIGTDAAVVLSTLASDAVLAVLEARVALGERTIP